MPHRAPASPRAPRRARRGAHIDRHRAHVCRQAVLHLRACPPRRPRTRADRPHQAAPPVAFSISHDHELVAMAFAPGTHGAPAYRLGVDVMRLHARQPLPAFVDIVGDTVSPCLFLSVHAPTQPAAHRRGAGTDPRGGCRAGGGAAAVLRGVDGEGGVHESAGPGPGL